MTDEIDSIPVPMSRRKFLQSLTLFSAVSVFLSAEGGKTGVKSVATQMFCPCGCRQILAECVCETAVKLREDIQKMIDQKMSREEILQEMVRQYGPTVLAAPQKKGFGLVAYILPLAAFLLSGSALFYFLRFRSSVSPAPAPSELSLTEADNNLRKEIEKEVLKEL